MPHRNAAKDDGAVRNGHRGHPNSRLTGAFAQVTAVLDTSGSVSVYSRDNGWAIVPALPFLGRAVSHEVSHGSPQHRSRNLVVPLCSDPSCLRPRQCSLGVEQIGNGSGADLVTLIRQPQAFLRVSDEGIGGGDDRKTLPQP